MTEVETDNPSPGRFEAFSDGVIAIAITLLILEVKVPDVEDGKLWHALGNLWPSYLAYAVSFLTIGIMWVNHHNITRRLNSISHGLLYANLALLGAISFLPFPTAVIAEYIRDGGGNEKAAAGLYGLTVLAISVAFGAMWMVVKRNPSIAKPGRIDDVNRQLQMCAAAFVVYVATFALSFVSAVAALVVFGAVTIGFAFNRLT